MRVKELEQRTDKAVPVILDTDCGPDCDDAGALAVLHALADLGEADILGIMHCTSSPWGVGCISAINSYYGRPSIPLGTLHEERFLTGASYEKYNKHLAGRYPHPYRNGKRAEKACRLYRRLLASAEDSSVVIIAIGPLINLYHLLMSGPDDIDGLDGVELIEKKVSRLAVMGGVYPNGKEWNFEMHPEAASFVAEHWPSAVTFCGYEIGESIRTGARLLRDGPPDHPVRKAYELYLAGEQARSSWDPITVLAGIREKSLMWSYVQGGHVTVDAVGRNEWKAEPAEGKNHRYVVLNGSEERLEAILEQYMCMAAKKDRRSRT